MSNPTTPFGWQMPENTDLVTDLPADFEVFGQAVATDLQYLLGGTTGQVLAKASGTDLDFDWVTDATGMTNPMTTTGDSIYSSSGSTPARLGIGSAGQVLTVVSGIPGWASASGAYTSLASGSMAAASIGVDLTSISSAYEDLILVASGLSFSGINANVSLRLNNDSGNNYGWSSFLITNLVTGGAVNTTAEIAVGITTASANTNGQIIMRFPNYADTTSGQIVESSGFVGTIISGGVGFWSTADAVNRITLFAGGTNFDAGTYELFGVK
jgi:hypothetical protein